MIKGYVSGQQIALSCQVIVADTIDYLEAIFLFATDDWKDVDKWAHFYKGDLKFDIELKNDAISRDMHLNLEAGTWTVFLHGTTTSGMRITTTAVQLEVQPSQVVDGQPLPEIPPSAAEQIAQNAKDALDTANKAQDIAEDALVEAGKTSVYADKAAESARQSEESNKSSAQHAANAKQSADNAKLSEQSADESEDAAKQALSDLLAMLGKDIATLVNGKIPVEQIPATALVEIFEVSSEQELTGLVAQKGDLGELIEVINGVRTITKTWQLLTNDPTDLANWVIWGSSYAVSAGNATTADNAENANMINNHRLVFMEKEQFDSAAKDPSTLYLVYYPKAEV